MLGRTEVLSALQRISARGGARGISTLVENFTFGRLASFM